MDRNEPPVSGVVSRETATRSCPSCPRNHEPRREDVLRTSQPRRGNRSAAASIHRPGASVIRVMVRVHQRTPSCGRKNARTRCGKGGSSRPCGSRCGSPRSGRPVSSPAVRSATARAWRRRCPSPRRPGGRGRPRARSVAPLPQRAAAARLRHPEVAEPRDQLVPLRLGQLAGRGGSRTTSTVDEERGERQDQAAEQAQDDGDEQQVQGLAQPGLDLVSERTRRGGVAPSTSGAPGSRAVLVAEPVAPGSVVADVVAPGTGAVAGIV